MIAGAASMIARRGVNATSVREVVRHTQTPRGSIAHHFPGGKQQLVEEAVTFAGQAISTALERRMQEQGALAGMRLFINLWRQNLEASKFTAGCPVLAVCLDHGLDTETTPDAASISARLRLLDVSNAAFADWQQIICGALMREGVSPVRAQRLATLAISAVEGTVAMCRAARNPSALDAVAAELELAVAAAIQEGGA